MVYQEYALIVAGGKGTRIKSSLPKQFIELNGKPILIHTIEAFYHYSEKIKIVLILPEDDFETWNALSKKFSIAKNIILQKGGETRFQSVKKGLQKIEGEGLVAIHDGVRPLVSKDIIGASFRLAAIHHCAIAAVQLKESLRIIDSLTESSSGSSRENTKAVDRSRYRLIQTPQTFEIALIKKAYELKEDATLTDDASVAERAGNFIFLFEGSYENIKITTQEDLLVAEALLRSQLPRLN